MHTPSHINNLKHRVALALIGAAWLGLSACSSMSQRDQSTAVGAGAGAIGGAILTGGSTVGTVGGAAVGAVIGNEIGKDRK